MITANFVITGATTLIQNVSIMYILAKLFLNSIKFFLSLLIVCHYDLDDEEKQFIDNWISRNRIGGGVIEWKNLRQDLRNQFGFLRSENMVKNYWYSKQRRAAGAARTAGAPVLLPLPPLPPISFILNIHFDPALEPYFKLEEYKLPVRI